MSAGEVGLNRWSTEDGVAAFDWLLITDYELLNQAYHTLYNGACAFPRQRTASQISGTSLPKISEKGHRPAPVVEALDGESYC